MSRLTANCLLLLAGLVWGLGFITQRTAMDDIGPFLFVGLRFTLATLVVLPFALVERARMRQTTDWRPFSPAEIRAIVSVGVVFFIMMMLQQIGILGTSVTNAGMLTGLYVVLVPIIAFSVWRQRQPAFVWPGAALAFAGIWLLGGGGLDKITWGDVVVIISAIFAALQVILLGRAVGDAGRPVAIATAQFAVTGVLGLIGFVIVRALDWPLEPAYSIDTVLSAAPEIAYSAIFAGGLAFSLQAIGQRHTGAADAAILLSSEALFAAIGAAILLGERLDMIGYVGCAMMFTAIVFVSVVSAKAEQAPAS